MLFDLEDIQRALSVSFNAARHQERSSVAHSGLDNKQTVRSFHPFDPNVLLRRPCIIAPLLEIFFQLRKGRWTVVFKAGGKGAKSTGKSHTESSVHFHYEKRRLHSVEYSHACSFDLDESFLGSVVNSSSHVHREFKKSRQSLEDIICKEGKESRILRSVMKDPMIYMKDHFVKELKRLSVPSNTILQKIVRYRRVSIVHMCLSRAHPAGIFYMKLKQDPLKSLAPFIRPWPTHRVGFWSKDARDMLRRAKTQLDDSLLMLTSTRSLALNEAKRMKMMERRGYSYASNELSSMFEGLSRFASDLLPRHRSILSENLSEVTEGLLLHYPKGFANEMPKYSKDAGQLCRYDLPQRRRNSAANQKIKERIRPPRHFHSGLPSTVNEVAPRNSPSHDSDESMLDIVIVSDEEMDDAVGDAAGIEGGYAECSEMNQCSEEGPTDELGARSIPQIPERTTAMRVTVPGNMPISAWSMRLAERFLTSMQSALLIAPPPLSLLPTVVAICSSLLARSHCDNRIAIVIVSETDETMRLRTYLDHCFAGSTSIDIHRLEGTESPTVISSTARIVIFNGFNDAVPPGFSLLVVLVSRPSLLCRPEATTRSSVVRLDANCVRTWRNHNSTIIAPLDEWTGVLDFLNSTGFLAAQLDVKRALFVGEYGDANTASLGARPRAFFLAPAAGSRACIDVLDQAAAPLLPVYNRAQSTVSSRHMRTVQSLTGVSIGRLVSLLQNGVADRSTQQDLWTLHALRQARSYAVQDGAISAAQYLAQVGRSADIATAKLQMTEHSLWAVAHTIIRPMHPAMRAARDWVTDVRNAVRREAPSVAGLRGQMGVRAALVTDSGEAGAALQGNVSGVTLVCGEDSSRILTDGSFSHVMHVADDRRDGVPESRLPEAVLCDGWAGRTTLSTAVVDESGSGAERWSANEAAFRRVATGLRNAGKQEMIVERDLRLVVRAAQRAAWVIEAGQGGMVEIGVDEACAVSIASLRERILRMVQAAMQRRRGRIVVGVLVGSGQREMPGRQYVEAAVRGNDLLAKVCAVETWFRNASQV